MRFEDVVAARRMVRAFEPTPVRPAVLDAVLDAARRAPSAGFTQAVELVVLEGAEETRRYWDATMPDPERRRRFRRPKLLAAPVLVVVVVRPAAYVERYGEPDKAATGLGAGEGSWAVPYWWVDAGMAVMGALLAATDQGLGALFFGVFEHEGALAAALGLPPGHRVVGTIALGHPAADDGPGGSAATRRRRALGDVVHRGGW